MHTASGRSANRRTAALSSLLRAARLCGSTAPRAMLLVAGGHYVFNAVEYSEAAHAPSPPSLTSSPSSWRTSSRASTSRSRTPGRPLPHGATHCTSHGQHCTGAGAQRPHARRRQPPGRPSDILDSGGLWSCGPGSHQAGLLQRSLKDCVKALVAILANLQPKRIPLDYGSAPIAVLYADAFFLDGERRIKAGYTSPPKKPRPRRDAAMAGASSYSWAT